MGVKIQHQMEVLNPICITPDMTAFTKWQFWIFILHCLMKRDGDNRMFPFAKRDISKWGSKYEPKNNSPGNLKNVCKQTPIKNPEVVVLLLLV